MRSERAMMQRCRVMVWQRWVGTKSFQRSGIICPLSSMSAADQCRSQKHGYPMHGNPERLVILAFNMCGWIRDCQQVQAWQGSKLWLSLRFVASFTSSLASESKTKRSGEPTRGGGETGLEEEPPMGWGDEEWKGNDAAMQSHGLTTMGWDQVFSAIWNHLPFELHVSCRSVPESEARLPNAWQSWATCYFSVQYVWLDPRLSAGAGLGRRPTLQSKHMSEGSRNQIREVFCSLQRRYRR